MKQKLLWSGLVLIALVGMVVVLYYSLQPRPLDKIKLSVFDSPTVASNSLQLRLRQELINQNVLFWGLDPNQVLHWEILNEFLKTNADPQLKFSKVLVDSSSEPTGRLNFAEAEIFDFTEAPEKLLSLIQISRSQNQRLLIILPHVYASQKVPDSFAQVITQKYEIPANSVLFVQVPRRRDQENKASIACNVADGDVNGTGRLGCLILQKARSLYLKKMESGKVVGYLDQIGGAEFVFALATEP